MPPADAAPDEPLALPRYPVAPPRQSFPLLAVLAPLVGAAALFAIMRSPYVLAFAALSPVVAVASTVDIRVSAARRRRRDARAHGVEASRFLAEVSAAHDRERAVLNMHHPAASACMADPALRPRRWTSADDRLSSVRIGTGRRTSALTVSGSAAVPQERELLAVARVVDRAPIVAEVEGGVGLIGVLPVARAALRGLVVQLAHAHPPGVLAISSPRGDSYDWLDDYPHAALSGQEPLRLRLVDEAAAHPSRAVAEPSSEDLPATSPPSRSMSTAVLAVAECVDELTTPCRLIVAVDAAGGFTVLAPPESVGSFQGELITAQQAAMFGRDLASTARTRGVERGRPLPSAVRFGDLPRARGGSGGGSTARPAERPAASSTGSAAAATRPPAPGSGHASGTLAATVGVTSSGPLVLDLLSSGPHAIVTGTTGSGKSELLITWVLAMAASARPEQVCFLLVDFKGGTAFERLAALPHTVGVVTDLAHGEAARALKSLRAELRRREAVLASEGVADVSAAGGALSRLVIVVDEAAAMFTAFPELGALFADAAARGRALGVHLILSTQRATGVLSDALVANCALRLSLRLAAESDSTALLGTPAAAHLPHSVRGRAVVALDGDVVTAQVGTSGAADVAAVARAHAAAARPRAPWLPALGDRIPLAAFGRPPGGSIVIGAADDPDRQAQEGVVYRPARAHLLVLGARGSGKSGVLAAIRSQWGARRADGGVQGPAEEVIGVPPDVEGAWDALQRAASRLDAASSGADGEHRGATCLVLIDDVDALLDRFGDEHRDAVADRIRALLVDGPHSGIGVVCTAAALPGGLRSAQGRFGERLVLRQPDRQEHVLAGAPAELWDPAAPPGRGVWRERLTQVALVESVDDARATGDEGASPPLLAFPPGSLTLLAARAPDTASRRLREHVPSLEVVDLRDVVSRLDAVFDRATPLVRAPRDDEAQPRLHEGRRPMAVVGDPDAWQSQWSALDRLRPQASLVFDGCTLAEVRAIVHARVLPPATQPWHVLVCDPAMRFSRARMPGR
jgi:S-DNA-T family DNA segregation ATPase FtsK/SpoIIIE